MHGYRSAVVLFHFYSIPKSLQLSFIHNIGYCYIRLSFSFRSCNVCYAKLKHVSPILFLRHPSLRPVPQPHPTDPTNRAQNLFELSFLPVSFMYTNILNAEDACFPDSLSAVAWQKPVASRDGWMQSSRSDLCSNVHLLH